MSFDAVAYLNHPRWQQVKPGLERIEALLGLMGTPQQDLRFVHVAGTNGKGSVSAMTASILQAAGLRTALFTSPFLFRFEERIRVNGAPIDPLQLQEVTLAVAQAADQLPEHPTEFELMTAVALEHFRREGCQMVVLETGLGGRLDSTNVIAAPEVCAITPIDLDHTVLLGDTVAQIAREKAGILKPGATMVSAVQPPEAAAVIAEVAQGLGTDVTWVDPTRCVVEGAPTPSGQTLSYRGLSGLRIPLAAPYQVSNAAQAVDVALALRERGWDVSDKAIRDGLSRVRWPGRFQVLASPALHAATESSLQRVASRESAPNAAGGSSPVHDVALPPVVLDGGHNAQGARALADSLAAVFPGRRVVFVMGVLADKDSDAMLEALLPMAKAVVCVQPDNPRALPAEMLARKAMSALADRDAFDDRSQGCVVVVRPDLELGVASALELANPDDVACCCGSLYAAGDFVAALERAGYEVPTF